MCSWRGHCAHPGYHCFVTRTFVLCKFILECDFKKMHSSPNLEPSNAEIGLQKGSLKYWGKRRNFHSQTSKTVTRKLKCVVCNPHSNPRTHCAIFCTCAVAMDIYSDNISDRCLMRKCANCCAPIAWLLRINREKNAMITARSPYVCIISENDCVRRILLSVRVKISSLSRSSSGTNKMSLLVRHDRSVLMFFVCILYISVWSLQQSSDDIGTAKNNRQCPLDALAEQTANKCWALLSW